MAPPNRAKGPADPHRHALTLVVCSGDQQFVIADTSPGFSLVLMSKLAPPVHERYIHP